VATPESRFEAGPGRQEELVTSFLTASRDGDLAGLEKLLAADATWWSDGGGRVSAALRPIEGREKVMRFLAGALERFTGGVDFTTAEVNGSAAVVAWAGEALIAVIAFEERGGLIAGMRTVVNPDKLGFAQAQLSGS
jgi:RNA polymerase sigma-70 factor (ECF subfamily)